MAKPLKLRGTAYQRMNGIFDNDDESGRPPPTPPEMTEDYLEAQRRMDAYIRMMEEGLTIFDPEYWALLFSDVWTFLETWGPWVKWKLFMLGVALAGSLFAGSIFMGLVAMILAIVGPIRIKSLGVIFMLFVMGTTVLTGSVEVAASSVLGVALMFYLFLLRVATGSKLQKGKLVTSDVKEPPVYLVVEFWYLGRRTLWINLSKGFVGLT